MTSEGVGKRITHVCFACFYIDGHSYQENLLPRFHQRLGHTVHIIASLVTFDDDGLVSELPGPATYENEDGIPVERLGYRRGPFARRLRTYRGTYRALAKTRPDVVFIHGPQFLDAFVVAVYLSRHREVVAFVDNHADFGNSATNRVSRWLLHGLIWRVTTRVLQSRVRRFYGVLPARVDFLHDVYGVPRDKTQLLVLGADDDLVARARAQSRKDLRAQYDLPADAFLVVSGGKVNEYRPEVLELMESVQDGEAPYEVVIFGSASPEFREPYENLGKCSRVHLLGWLDTQQALDVMAAADVVIFPGKHSVLWEQAVAVGAPLVVRALPGTNHVDLDGNCRFLERGDRVEIRGLLTDLAKHPETLREMRSRA